MEPAVRIPQFDLRAQHAGLAAELRRVVDGVFASGQFVLGPQGRAFEHEAAAYLGCTEAVGCNSGTDALELALRALGVGPGDEVVTTPFSFFATAEAICNIGARPVFADIDPRSFNLDPVAVEAALSARTRALLPVHLFGQPAAMEPLLELARHHGLVVVEDCAQSFGAPRGSRMTGSLGDAGCFSFFPTKNLGACGDAGLVTTSSAELAGRVRELRNHGGRARHEHPELGCNSRLDEIQAAVLRVKLPHVDAWNTARRRVAARYSEALEGLPGLVVPWHDPGGRHVFHQYTVLLDRREDTAEALDAAGVGCAVHYPRPLHRQPPMGVARVVGDLPVATDVASRCLSLPMFPELDDAAVERVVDALRATLRGGRATRPA